MDVGPQRALLKSSAWEVVSEEQALWAGVWWVLGNLPWGQALGEGRSGSCYLPQEAEQMESLDAQ